MPVSCDGLGTILVVTMVTIVESNHSIALLKVTNHSALIRNLIKLKGTAKLTAQDEWVYLKDAKYILFEILENRRWKGCTSSCQPSKPDLAIWLAQPTEACIALPCPTF